MKKGKLLLLLFTCLTVIVLAKTMIRSGNQPAGKITAKKTADRVKPDSLSKISYDSSIRRVVQLKKGLAVALNNEKGLTGESAKKAAGLFTDILVDHLLPHWIGTPWDFNGTTQQPGTGQIACGYFVTTLLRDAGVILNRVKLAQCASGKIISSQVQKMNEKNYSSYTFEGFISEIKGKGKGVFIIGLDFHTGFLINDGTELYFVHSNYIGRKGVVKEPASESVALRSSKWRSTGWLTNDNPFLVRWLRGSVANF
jgi:hypothetical protein